MHIAVIAANGRTGRVFTKAALTAGHTVRAGIHTMNPFADQPGLTVVRCDATNPNDLRNLLDGQDAVVSFIGHSRKSAPDVQTQTTRHVIAIMQELGLKRIVSLTGTGVRFPGDRITFIDTILNSGITLIDPARVHDGRTHAVLLRSSDLEWTILRVLKLQNTKPRPFRLREQGPTKPYVSRQEVADACLQVLEQHSFVHQAPIIGRP